jgi:aspartyl aminopeptidase
VPDSVRSPAGGSAHDLIDFIAAAPSPFHACAEAAARLAAAGFTELAEVDRWPAGGRRFIRRGGSLVAWAGPTDAAATSPFRIVGAHTDSPNLRIKPRPDTGRAGVRQLGIEVYGGPLLNSWLGRDLGLSGRVGVRDEDGGIDVRLVKVDRPLLFIPQLAIHLDRQVNTEGLRLNPQDHLNPVWAVGPPDEGGFARWLAKELGVDEASIMGWELMAHDLAPPTLLGADDELLAAPRLDNLCSTAAAVAALTAAADREESATTSVLALFDHEEVGSTTAQGAAGPMLAATLERVVAVRGGTRDDLHRALAGSMCVSADMAHATHPNYPERHDPAHWIALNGGPVIKTNVSRRYATDAETTAVFVEACDRAGVPVQHYVHRNDSPCGSTIGPITAAELGVPVVDVGAPQLAMHSARELMGADDYGLLADALAAFLVPIAPPA